MAKFAATTQGSYCLALPTGRVLDGRHGTAGAQWANDLNVPVKGPPGAENNLKFTGKDGRELVAVRDIEVGEELFVGYGPRFWAHKRIPKRKRKHRQPTKRASNGKRRQHTELV